MSAGCYPCGEAVWGWNRHFHKNISVLGRASKSKHRVRNYKERKREQMKKKKKSTITVLHETFLPLSKSCTCFFGLAAFNKCIATCMLKKKKLKNCKIKARKPISDKKPKTTLLKENYSLLHRLFCHFPRGKETT